MISPQLMQKLKTILSDFSDQDVINAIKRIEKNYDVKNEKFLIDVATEYKKRMTQEKQKVLQNLCNKYDK